MMYIQQPSDFQVVIFKKKYMYMYKIGNTDFQRFANDQNM